MVLWSWMVEEVWSIFYLQTAHTTPEESWTRGWWIFQSLLWWFMGQQIFSSPLPIESLNPPPPSSSSFLFVDGLKWREESFLGWMASRMASSSSFALWKTLGPLTSLMGVFSSISSLVPWVSLWCLCGDFFCLCITPSISSFVLSKRFGDLLLSVANDGNIKYEQLEQSQKEYLKRKWKAKPWNWALKFLKTDELAQKMEAFSCNETI